MWPRARLQPTESWLLFPMASPMSCWHVCTKIDLGMSSRFGTSSGYLLTDRKKACYFQSCHGVKPRDHFLHIYFCPRFTGPWSKLDPKGWSLNQFSLKGLGGTVCSGRKLFPETWRAFGSGCLGRPFNPLRLGPLTGQTPLLFPQKQCLHLNGKNMDTSLDLPLFTMRMSDP